MHHPLQRAGARSSAFQTWVGAFAEIMLGTAGRRFCAPDEVRTVTSNHRLTVLVLGRRWALNEVRLNDHIYEVLGLGDSVVDLPEHGPQVPSRSPNERQ